MFKQIRFVVLILAIFAPLFLVTTEDRALARPDMPQNHHLWVTLKALDLLPAEIKTEVYQATWLESGDVFGQPAVVAGAHDEDNITGNIDFSCYKNIDIDLTNYHHGWDPDKNDFWFNFILPIGCFADDEGTALDWADWYFGDAIRLYEAGDKVNAYYLLGRAVHLLGDMSTPAHTLLDPHLPLVDPDSYEDYLKREGTNRTEWDPIAVYQDLRISIPEEELTEEVDGKTTLEWFNSTGGVSDSASELWEMGPVNYSTPAGGRVDPDFFHLYYDLAEYSDEFDSDEDDGEGQGYPYDVNTHGILDKYIEDSDLMVFEENLIPKLGSYTAAVIQLFWDRTHMRDQAEVVQPVNGSQFMLPGQLDIQIRAGDKYGVDDVFLYVNDASQPLNDQYIGMATFNDQDDLWHYLWDTSGWSPGDYILRADISPRNGSVFSEASTFSLVEEDHQPVLRYPSVAPPIGDSSTQFDFSVTYVHFGEVYANTISLFVNGNEYPLALESGDPLIGIPHTISLSGFAPDSYSYYFRADAGDDTVQTDPLTFTVIESAVGHDLTLVTVELSRSSGEPGDSVTIRGQVNNSGDYREDNISIDVSVTGPGSYTWTDTKNIGSLDPIGGNYIWGMADISTWNIPSGAADGEYQVNVTVSSPSGDENLSDNTKIRSVYVSDGDPLVHMAYWYKYQQLEWDWTHPELPSPFDTWGAYGPATTTYGSKTYQIWGFPQSGGAEWRYYVKDTSGTEYLNYYDNDWDSKEAIYEDNDKLLFGADWYVSDDFAWFKIGHPETNATITPLVQSVPMGEYGAYTINIPCGSCSYNDAEVYEASGGDDPPWEFFHSEWPSYDIDDNGPTFQLSLEPYSTSLENFAFDTNEEDLTTTNYILFGRVDGYHPVDNPPVVNITYPTDQLTVSGSVSVSATAVDDKGISRVEFWIDNVLKHTDTSSPYSFAWDTTQYSDGPHSVMAKAFDTAGQMSSFSVTVTVDNHPPSITNAFHTPENPTDTDSVTIEATISDVSGISVATLLYSMDGGSSWVPVNMSNISADQWQGAIPAADQGQVKYKISATDTLARSTESGESSYQVADATAPSFYGWSVSPANLTEDSSGLFTIHVSVVDYGGSGLQGMTPQLDYRVGSETYDGYENMTLVSGSQWLFEIPAQDWNAVRGQTLYYKARISDVAENERISEERSELIDSLNDAPEIAAYAPNDLTPAVEVGSCLEFSVTATDDDGDILAFEWQLDGSQVSVVSTYTYCPGGTDDGQHNVVVIVSDGLAASSKNWQVSVTSGVTQEIPLLAGWNMISSYVIPDNPDMWDVFDDIIADVVIVKNGAGVVFWPEFGVNNIGNWNAKDGYQVYMAAPATLSITGTPADPTMPNDLPAGWSLIAYLRDTPMPIEEALDTILDKIIIVKDGDGKVYWPEYGVDNIVNLEPGKGYQLYLSAPGTLMYPPND